MTPTEARRLDEATVVRLTETSWSGDPRELLLDCRLCDQPHWARSGRAGYCSESCYWRAWYARNRDAKLAQVAARYRRRKGREEAAA